MCHIPMNFTTAVPSYCHYRAGFFLIESKTVRGKLVPWITLSHAKEAWISYKETLQQFHYDQCSLQKNSVKRVTTKKKNRLPRAGPRVPAWQPKEMLEGSR